MKDLLTITALILLSALNISPSLCTNDAADHDSSTTATPSRTTSMNTPARHVDNNIPSYGTDVSFPMHTANASSTEIPGVDRNEFFQNYIQGCRDYWDEKRDEKKKGPGGNACDAGEHGRIRMNIDQPRSMVNYTDVGYRKIKAPKHVFDMILNFWEQNQNKEKDEKWGSGNIYVNYWENPSKMIDVHLDENKGGGEKLVKAVHDAAKPVIQEWTGQNLIPSSLYGIRVYREGAVLAPHVDRNPLINSGIINVAQDVDEPWPLEVIGHDGIAVNITMEPGDMVLYESHSVIHGRPYPLKGRYLANIFIHYEPDASMMHESGSDLPPYILENSIYAQRWEKTNSGRARRVVHDDGQHELHLAGRNGNIRHMERVLKELVEESSDDHDDNYDEEDGDIGDDDDDVYDDDTVYDDDDAVERKEEDIHPDLIEKMKEHVNLKDNNGWTAFHEATRQGHIEMVRYMVEKLGVDVNEKTGHGVGPAPLEIAKQDLHKDHPVIHFLLSHGAHNADHDEL